MTPSEFLKTIYLGDRYCTKIVFDNKNKRFELHINLISRIRDLSGQWNYYNDENIENGIIVFADIKEISIVPNGLMPNDEVYNIVANKVSDEYYEFIIEACNIDNLAKTNDVKITLMAKEVYLLDPLKPEIFISN